MRNFNDARLLIKAKYEFVNRLIDAAEARSIGKYSEYLGHLRCAIALEKTIFSLTEDDYIDEWTQDMLYKYLSDNDDWKNDVHDIKVAMDDDRRL